ncbi:glycosyltransferase [Corallibacter sp.]|uniref:glycosyltransferase n=1 Tax=Corallibacter sp. TaxID=2038084 RepID=UPI003AB5C31E
MRTLTIISHTEHYFDKEGQLVGLGATVMEINQLLSIFDKIYHVAMLYKNPAPASCLPYASNAITFVPIPKVGGKKITDKLAIVGQMPAILKRISKTLKHSDYFQFRAPTGIGVFVLPYLIYLYHGKGWFKYAGDWSAQQSPIAYKFQNYLLKNQKRQVTINGSWPNQKSNCITFENPCLTDQEIVSGHEITAIKKWNEKAIELCFVGRLEANKGLDLFLNALALLSEETKQTIKKVHVVGGGTLLSNYKTWAEKLNITMTFYGVLSRNDVHEIYKKSHGIVLPSKSEGFPKVIAEALNYGCIPVVSDIYAIRDYITHEKNGFLIPELSVHAVANVLNTFLKIDSVTYKKLIEARVQVVNKFSYNYYNEHLIQSVL